MDSNSKRTNDDAVMTRSATKEKRMKAAEASQDAAETSTKPSPTESIKNKEPTPCCSSSDCSIRKDQDEEMRSSSSEKNSDQVTTPQSDASTTKSELRVLLRAEKIRKAKRKQKMKELIQDQQGFMEIEGMKFKELKEKYEELENTLISERLEVSKQKEAAEKYKKLYEDGLRARFAAAAEEQKRTQRLRVEEQERLERLEKAQLERRIQEIGVFEVLRERNPENNEEETRSERLERKTRQNNRIQNWLSGHSKKLCSSPIDYEPSEPSTFTQTQVDDGQRKEDFAYPDYMCWTRSEAKSLALKEKMNKGKHNSFAWNNPRHFLRDAAGDALDKYEVDEIRIKIRELLREHLIENKKVRKGALISLKEFDRNHIDFNKLTSAQIAEEVECYLLNSMYWKQVRYEKNYTKGFRRAVDEYRLDLSWCDDDWKIEEIVKAELTKLRSDGRIKSSIRDHQYESTGILKKVSKKRKASSSLVKEEDYESGEDVKFEVESSTHSWKLDSQAPVYENPWQYKLNPDMREVSKRLYQELSSVGDLHVTRKLCRRKLEQAGGNTFDAREALYEHFDLRFPRSGLVPSKWKRTEAKKIRRLSRLRKEFYGRQDEEDEDETHPTSKSSPQTGITRPSTSKVKLT